MNCERERKRVGYRERGEKKSGIKRERREKEWDKVKKRKIVENREGEKMLALKEKEKR